MHHSAESGLRSLWICFRYDLHVLLVEHGKRCVRCSKNGRPRKEQHGPCPLANLAAAAKAGQKLSAKKAVEDAEQSLKEEEGSPAGNSIQENQGITASSHALYCSLSTFQESVPSVDLQKITLHGMQRCTTICLWCRS